MNRYHDQYLRLMQQLDHAVTETISVPKSLHDLIDNLVTVSFWNSQHKINWQDRHDSPGVIPGWTILDETVMLLDGLTDRSLNRDQNRKLGFFVLNLPKKLMRPGTNRRWSDLCDRIKRSSLFYEGEAGLTYGSQANMLREYHRYFLDRFGQDTLKGVE